MSPANLFEPTYFTIKSRLMQGVWLPGERLEVARLASELGVSITPIRDSLNRLAGENLVDASAGAGFRVPLFQEQGLVDILRLNAFLLRGAIVMRGGGWDAFHDVASDYATRCAHLFAYIARRSGNVEIMQVIRNLTERMHWLRSLEVTAFDGSESELAGIKEAIEHQAPLAVVDDLVQDYHQRRVQGCIRYLHALPGRK